MVIQKTTYEFLTNIILIEVPCCECYREILGYPFVGKAPYLKNDRKIIVRGFVNTPDGFTRKTIFEASKEKFFFSFHRTPNYESL